MKVQAHHELLWELILRWYAVECEIAGDPLTFPPPRAAPLQLIIAVAKDKVINVLCGETRWSECSLGDRAVWTMRSRMQDVRAAPDIKQVARAAWHAGIEYRRDRGAPLANNIPDANRAFEQWYQALDQSPETVRENLEQTMEEIQQMTPEEAKELHQWEPYLHA